MEEPAGRGRDDAVRRGGVDLVPTADEAPVRSVVARAREAVRHGVEGADDGAREGLDFGVHPVGEDFGGGAALGFVRVQQLREALRLEDERQLPREVCGVVHSNAPGQHRVHALAVRGAAAEKDAVVAESNGRAEAHASEDAARGRAEGYSAPRPEDAHGEVHEVVGSVQRVGLHGEDPGDALAVGVVAIHLGAAFGGEEGGRPVLFDRHPLGRQKLRLHGGKVLDSHQRVYRKLLRTVRKNWCEGNLPDRPLQQTQTHIPREAWTERRCKSRNSGWSLQTRGSPRSSRKSKPSMRPAQPSERSFPSPPRLPSPSATLPYTPKTPPSPPRRTHYTRHPSPHTPRAPYNSSPPSSPSRTHPRHRTSSAPASPRPPPPRPSAAPARATTRRPAPPAGRAATRRPGARWRRGRRRRGRGRGRRGG
mmetsp:Transcript_27276/g.68434  ORF Transcript_27276/g.68434 Transcript_27276/m.68434 type:complete len:422 (-) Transcript_27276:85-1350(-)